MNAFTDRIKWAGLSASHKDAHGQDLRGSLCGVEFAARFYSNGNPGGASGHARVTVEGKARHVSVNGGQAKAKEAMVSNLRVLVATRLGHSPP